MSVVTIQQAFYLALPHHQAGRLDREDSPWYPTMRLFRQPALGDWDSVFQRVTEELKKRSRPFGRGAHVSTGLIGTTNMAVHNRGARLEGHA